ncbi:MAG: S-adenosyl-l-methionine hydroxide adenosyltransferase family protein [Desulfovibrionaceae bacterium]
MPPVVLLTDFGTMDPYAGQLRGALATLAPGAPILDLTHGVAPHNVVQAGFFLSSSLGHFPAGSVFLAVVDPGVGTDRRIVLARFGSRFVLAPDNGLLGLALFRRPDAACWDCSRAVARLLDATPVSATFHGRDVFVPLAARLLAGEPPEALGVPVPADSLVPAPMPDPAPFGAFDPDGQQHTRVLHVDRFGNAVLGLLDHPVPAPGRPVVLVAPRRARLTCVTTYADIEPGEAGLLPGSQGFLEVAANRASAAALLGLASGMDVTLALA